MKGYETCHNTEEVMEMMGYDSERDVWNPTGSVFCANGAGFLVDWDEVKKHMHIESCLQKKDDFLEEKAGNKASYVEEKWMDPEEVERIFKRTFYANQGKKSVWKKRKTVAVSYYTQTSYTGKLKEVKDIKGAKDEYLLVDGYNVIFSWHDLKELAEYNIESARTKLLDYLSKYQGVRKCKIIAVFDAYRVQNHHEEMLDYDTIHVVYTREAQTADHFIEKFAHDNQEKYDITVATSDGLQQIIIRGAGCAILSARELKDEIERTNERVLRDYQEKQPVKRNYLKDSLSAETKQQMEEFVKEEKGG